MSQNYTPTEWIDNRTVGTASIMNNMEKGIEDAHDRIDGVDSQIKNIEIRIDNIDGSGGSIGGEVDLSGYVTKETGNASQITFADGQTFQAKLDAGTLKGDKGDKGDAGEQGPQGPQGPAGANGADGLTTSISVNGTTYTQVDGLITLPNYPTGTGSGTGSNNASDISITDTGNYFTNSNVEGVLQEVGSQIKKNENELYLLDIEPDTATINTQNIKDALLLAEQNNIHKIVFPKEKFFEVEVLGSLKNNCDATFIIPSNLEIDLNGCTIKVAANGFQSYELFEFSELTKNSKLKNGILIGDRYEHNYETVNDTHEYGHGVNLRGSNNVVESLEIKQFIGDGCYMGGFGNMNYSLKLTATDFTRNYIDKTGAVQTSTTAMLSRELVLSDYGITGEYNTKIYPYFGDDVPIDYDYTVRLHFFDSANKYIDAYETITHNELYIPVNATSMRVELQNCNDNFTDVVFIYKSKIGRNNTIQNCHIWDCRRQGISTSGNENGKILNNHIHDIDGVLPKCGIDIEDTRYTLNSLLVEGNNIYNCNGGALTCFDGYNITIKNNKLNGNRTGGAISFNNSRDVRIENNLLINEVGVGHSNYLDDCEFPNNIFIGNIVKSNGTRCTFNYVYASSNIFENSVCEARKSVLEKNKFRYIDMYPLSNSNRFNVDGENGSVFKDCEFIDERTIAHSERRLYGDFENCIFNMPSIQLKINNFLRNSKLNLTTTFSIDCNGNSVVIDNNTISGCTSTTMKIILTGLSQYITNNHFYNPDGVGSYTTCAIQNLNSNSKRFTIIEGNRVTNPTGRMNGGIFPLENLDGNTIIFKENYFETKNILLFKTANITTISDTSEYKIYVKNNYGSFQPPATSDNVKVNNVF